MNQDVLVERLFQTLTSGDREAARGIVNETIQAGVPAERLSTGLFAPALAMIHKLHRADQLSSIAYHFSMRLLRTLTDQAQSRLVIQPRNGRNVLVVCGIAEADELAACLASDLIEAGGYHVEFVGGGVPADEIMARVGENRPDVLLLYSSSASDLPDIRRLIDSLHDVQVCPQLQIAVGGGVYCRAEGLAEEIGADLYLPNLEEAVTVLNEEAGKRATPDQRTVGRKRRTRRVA